ncbi:hypothetical protein CVT24_003950 [Panaeolus cyanescens]|uniref:Uncharacterized protein n=1 Tax=Panaeolus cyanescens TaxID=181874 RepID=A0A409Y6F1_9AGAR|nr:hypothetical protein CVT24_003950 [Panaeolus cyanescens]
MTRRLFSQPLVNSPTIGVISGSTPGLLDPTQPSRLLRTPDASLSFAAFDPYVAQAGTLPAFHNLSLGDNGCRPKRIVIETIPGRGSLWRWVPAALKKEGVEDEGSFPRVIKIQNKLYQCDQDQWDLYKLDPAYECIVGHSSELTTITHKEETIASREPTPVLSSELSVDEDGDFRMRSYESDESTPGPRPSNRRTLPRTKLKNHFNFIRQHQPDSPPKAKRKVNNLYQSLQQEESPINQNKENDDRDNKLYTLKEQKRARTLSPGAKRRAMETARHARQAQKQKRWHGHVEEKRHNFEEKMMAEAIAEAMKGKVETFAQQQQPFENIIEEEEEVAQDAERDLEESRRKMAELNADRPKQRYREKTVGLEDDGVRCSDGKQEEEARHRLAREREAQEAARRQQEQENQARLREQERVRRQERLGKLMEQRDLRHRQWESGYWTNARALERYKHVAQFFDAQKFSEDEFPLWFMDIPWPTLQHPSLNSSQEMDCRSVNDFFAHIKQTTRIQEYKKFLRSTFKRFHPDTWDGRRLFYAIIDPQERNEIQTAVDVVSKAVGALFEAAKAEE